MATTLAAIGTPGPPGRRSIRSRRRYSIPTERAEPAAGLPQGFELHRGWLGAAEQDSLLAEMAGVILAAPLYRPTMPRSGRPLSVLMTNCGTLGWISDRAGYRYVAEHPLTGRSWPAIPSQLLDVWRAVAPGAPAPQACLVNYYDARARLGLHRDEDEADFNAPVVSVSLGDSAVFQIGGLARNDKVRSLDLASGDVCVLGGPARLAFHGVARIRPGTSNLTARFPAIFADGGRINLTLRRVGDGGR